MDARQKLENKIIGAVVSAVGNPAVPAQPGAVSPIVEAVTSKILPEIINATNNEPWYRSRVTLGALLAAISGILGAFGYALPAELQGNVIDLIIALGPVVGGALALYGRWAAKKPIGG
ncbi:hypothetical protein N181_25220 [Sinorhizobium fredii USDA 205]|uniref:Uncharacterized protein n=2 Tax=Sinorhizobium TaxID=28105 RepID=A0A844AF32_RHIFR|nr:MULTISPECIES: hypothetical protein [Sinorhizobium]KSV83681.1 hypothetical protein N181_25220 [Sinorhizobium fredii USDA 205]MQX10742.1 hypothetical protein [Sinorhizobium fredii]OAP40348.1 hypothetical protein AU381_00015 [Sinorhizobium glycinis]GEC33570.1 hypothetical protein EFR01_37410 [Sinorhizobium fredii]GLS11871.1 hypothetical protein GCM10007864_55030 [Sinorhizobium fredii]